MSTKRIALIEFGSNAIRFVYARVSPHAVRVLEEDRLRVRLAGGPDGALQSEVVATGLAAVDRFVQQVRALPQQQSALTVRAIATASVRDAPNPEQLLNRLPQLGVDECVVLSSAEEGLLGAESALRLLEATPIKRGAIVDLGGGSLQWTDVDRHQLGRVFSLPLGAARLRREFVRNDPPTAAELQGLRDSVMEQLRCALPSRPEGGRLVVLGGTGRALARRKLRSAMGAKAPAGDLSLKELSKLRKRLATMSVTDRKLLPGVRPERADILVAGALVLEQVMELGGFERFTACRASVRDGLLWREARSVRGTS